MRLNSCRPQLWWKSSHVKDRVIVFFLDFMAGHNTWLHCYIRNIYLYSTCWNVMYPINPDSDCEGETLRLQRRFSKIDYTHKKLHGGGGSVGVEQIILHEYQLVSRLLHFHPAPCWCSWESGRQKAEEPGPLRPTWHNSLRLSDRSLLAWIYLVLSPLCSPHRPLSPRSSSLSGPQSYPTC